MLAHRIERLGCRHVQALAGVDRDDDLEVTEPQTVSVEQALRIALAERFAVTVDIDAVRTQVIEVVNTTLVVDCGVLAGDVAIRVGQNPVVLQRAADRAAFLAEDVNGIVAHELAVLRDYFELQWHDS